MIDRPSERCGGCIWWCEEPAVCEGCPNNPDTKKEGWGQIIARHGIRETPVSD